MNHRHSVIRTACGTLPLIGFAFVLSSLGDASPSALEFRLRDDCDPATFNAAVGPGTCTGNGGTTFQRFLQELQEDQTVGSWRINPDHTGIDAGQTSLLVSRAGELHTFTRVNKFGGGIVPLLNQLSGNTVVAAECENLNPVVATPGNTPVFPFASVPGPTAGTAALPVGTTKFQCCIHPWMRTTVEVKRR